MAEAVDFEGTNVLLGAPAGRDDVAPLKAFTNGNLCITCWELSADEIAEVQRTGRIWLSLMFGKTMPPAMIGSEETIRKDAHDYGGTFPRQKRPALSQLDLHNRLAGQIVRSIVRPPLQIGGTFADVLTLLESVVIGVILAGVKLGGDEPVLDGLLEGVKARLADLRKTEREAQS